MPRITAHSYTLDDLRAMEAACTYPGKICTDPRTIKPSGELHKLCDFHRKKGNQNQGRLQQRRRVLRAQLTVRVTQLENSGAKEGEGEAIQPDGDAAQLDDPSLQFLFVVSSGKSDGVEREAGFSPSSLSSPFLLSPSFDRHGSDCCFDGLTPQDAQLLQHVLDRDIEYPKIEYPMRDDDMTHHDAFALGEALEYSAFL